MAKKSVMKVKTKGDKIEGSLLDTMNTDVVVEETEEVEKVVEIEILEKVEESVETKIVEVEILEKVEKDDKENETLFDVLQENLKVEKELASNENVSEEASIDTPKYESIINSIKESLNFDNLLICKNHMKSISTPKGELPHNTRLYLKENNIISDDNKIINNKSMSEVLKNKYKKLVPELEQMKKISKTEFEKIQNINNGFIGNIFDDIADINDFIKDNPDTDEITLSLMLSVRKNIKSLSNTIISITNSIRKIIVDDYIGIDKCKLFEECIQGIMTSSSKTSNETEEDMDKEPVVYSLIDSEDISKLLSKAKFNNCRDYVKKLSHLIHNLTKVDIENIVLSEKEKNSTMSKILELESKEFISNSTLSETLSNIEYYTKPEIKSISSYIKVISSGSHDKHIINICEFIIKEILLNLMTDTKNSLKELSKRNSITIRNYMKYFNQDIHYSELVGNFTQDIIANIPDNVTCLLEIYKESDIKDNEDDDISKIMITGLIYNSILSDDFIENNINEFSELRQVIESYDTTGDAYGKQLVEIAKNYKNVIIEHFQLKSI